MARKVKAAMQPVAVNPEKIVRGLTTVFQGFSVMFDGMAEQMQLMQDMTDQLSFPGAAPPVDTPKEAVKVEDAATVPTEVDAATEKTIPQTADTANADDTPQDVDGTDEDTPPWEEAEEQSAPTETKPVTTITQDDIVKTVVAKIKLNRSNNAKIGKLLGAYGVKTLGDLPVEKYEAFLSDIAQL